MSDQKILITGGTGELGRAIYEKYNCLALPKQSLDVRNFIQINDFLKNHPSIEYIIHAAAITSVTKCEEEKQLAYDVNVQGTRNLIRAMEENHSTKSGFYRNMKLIYVSTPCIFDGRTGSYDEDSIAQPENYYGLTKLISEELVKSSNLKWLIVRTNFVAKKEWAYPKAFKDRFGTYMFADQVADSLNYHINNSEGIVHIVGREKISMYDLAKITTKKVKPMTLKEYYRGNNSKPKLTVDMSMKSKRWIVTTIDRR